MKSAVRMSTALCVCHARVTLKRVLVCRYGGPQHAMSVEASRSLTNRLCAFVRYTRLLCFVLYLINELIPGCFC